MNRAEALTISSRKDRFGQPLPFSLRFVTLDRNRRGKPSRHMRLIGTRCGAKHDLYRHGQISVQPLNGGHPVPVHIDLITHINDEPVI